MCLFHLFYSKSQNVGELNITSTEFPIGEKRENERQDAQGRQEILAVRLPALRESI
jgi:hypothetical protein